MSRSLTTVVLFLGSLAAALASSSMAPAAAGAQGATGSTPAARVTVNDLVGTWTLESAERGVQTRASRVQDPRGLLIFDSAGHVFELTTRSGIPIIAQGQLTPADALTKFKAFGGFWGGYRLDPAKKTITYKAEGAVSPTMMGREFERTVELTDKKLVITSAAEEPHTEGGARWVWERVPQVDNLSPGYRRVIGFWRHVVEKRINLTANTSVSTERAPSIIVYSPSGYVGVHFPPMNRQPFASTEPTDVEARAAVTGVVSYYGSLNVYPNMVFHQILAGLTTPSPGTTLKRPFEMTGNTLTIKFPIATNQQGQQTTTWVTLNRLSGAADMLPK